MQTVSTINVLTGKPYTPEDYRNAARANIVFARMGRLQGRPAQETTAHLSLADLYIKQELRRDRRANAAPQAAGAEA